MMIKLATVFSGIGSIEQALKRLNIPHTIVFACDNGEIELKVPLDVEAIRDEVFSLSTKEVKKEYVDELYARNSRQGNYVQQTYFANYDISPNDFHLDIRFLDGRDYNGMVDLLVGGSPCQSFSTVGARKGFDDTRGTLFYEFARIIHEVQPRAFIYENVRGIVTHDVGRTWDIIQRVFREDLGYDITPPQVLNAVDYGIPQNRRRLFVIGFRRDVVHKDFMYPLEKKLRYTMQDFLEDNCAFGDFNYDTHSGELLLRRSKGVVDRKFYLTEKVRDYVLTSGTKNFQTATDTDLPIARTLLKTMTQHHRAGVDNYITVTDSPKVLRSLTDREALRLMGYPDSFKIVVSSRQVFKQAGNSIVVDVMMAIVRELIETGVFDV